MRFECQVRTCPNDGSRVPPKGVFFVDFPDEPEDRAKWARFCFGGDDDDEVIAPDAASKAAVCSRHFDRHIFYRKSKSAR